MHRLSITKSCSELWCHLHFVFSYLLAMAALMSIVFFFFIVGGRWFSLSLRSSSASRCYKAGLFWDKILSYRSRLNLRWHKNSMWFPQNLGFRRVCGIESLLRYPGSSSGGVVDGSRRHGQHMHHPPGCLTHCWVVGGVCRNWPRVKDCTRSTG